MHFGIPAQRFLHLRLDGSQGSQAHALMLGKTMAMPRFQIPTIEAAEVVQRAQVGFCDDAERKCQDAMT